MVVAMRVLLVEDDVKLTGALQRGLQREGYAVDLAATGDEALRQADVYDYDAVVLDVMLPGPDGFAVCDEMRRRELSMPVLMLTARDSVSDRIKGLDAGADDYLVKPFDSESCSPASGHYFAAAPPNGHRSSRSETSGSIRRRTW
jgi:two-component system OmpR family response regulator